MKKVLVILMLCLVSNVAMAAWIKLAERDGIALYFDDAIYNDATRKADFNASLSVLIDYGRTVQDLPHGKGRYLSMKTRLEIDCNKKLTREYGHIAYSGNMGNGNVIGSDDIFYEWEPFDHRVVHPSGKGELWAVVCK